MRKLKGYVHIKAPVHAVKQFAETGRRADWLVTKRPIWLHSISESWEATEVNGETRFTLHLDYRARLPFLEPLVRDGLHQSVNESLSRLKALAEGAEYH